MSVIIIISLGLFSASLMFLPVFAQESTEDIGPHPQPSYPPIDANGEHQPSDPMPTPPHEPDPTIHEEPEKTTEVAIDKNDNINLKNEGTKVKGIDEDTVEVYKIPEKGNEETKQRVMGSLTIGTSPNENNEFLCVITYVVSTPNGTALLQFFFLVTASDGTYDNIEKICYGKAVGSNATVKITVMKDETIQLEINDVDLIDVPKEFKPHTTVPKEQQVNEELKPPQNQHYDGPVYNAGPEFETVEK